MARKKVSIHAPTRGATTTWTKRNTLDMFQSTRPRGARQWYRQRKVSTETFQSTRPRGARRVVLKRPLSSLSFNPRAHAGRDLFLGCVVFFTIVSIHAPTRGATQISQDHNCTLRFQSTRPRGARPQATFIVCLCLRFNPRAHAGRDRGCGCTVRH